MENVLTTLALSGASLVGKAALSYAQGIAVKRISSFLQSRVESTSQNLAHSTSTKKKLYKPGFDHYRDSSDNNGDAYSDCTTPASFKTPSSPYPILEAATQTEERFKLLRQLQQRLEHKLALLTPAIDLCEWAAARGHSVLESILTLSNDLNASLDTLSQDFAALPLDKPDVVLLDAIVETFQDVLQQVDNLVPFVQMGLQISGVQFGNRVPVGVSPVLLMRASAALTRINDEAQSQELAKSQQPLDSIALGQSGLSTKDTSPIAGKEKEKASKPESDIHKHALSTDMPKSFIPGPTINIKLYTLFEGSSRSRTVVDWTWKEEYPKCRARLCRHPTEFNYSLHLDQDLNDGRFHDPEESTATPSTLDQNSKFIQGGKRHISLEHIQRLFYTNSGKLLNIEDASMPVLVLKVVEPRYSENRKSDIPITPNDVDSANDFGQSGGTELKPRVLWLALELFDTTVNTDDDAATESVCDASSCTGSEVDDESDVESLSGHVQDLDIGSQITPKNKTKESWHTPVRGSTRKPLAAATTDGGKPSQSLGKYLNSSVSRCGHTLATPINNQRIAAEMDNNASKQHVLGELCFLEYLLRLASLEQSQATSHLNVSDEKLYFFLMNEATGGNNTSNTYSFTQNPPSQQQQCQGTLTHAGGAGIAAMASASGDVPIHATVRKQPRSAPYRRDLGLYERQELQSSPLASKTTAPTTRFVDKLREV
ncbi:hypothetical protein BDV3_001200 [Batrachochytrium dendrobatidis]|uniref:Uncharacterized protein n=1 Tax=Batrachochytrium dendrobatidis (strain JEL423) TaxID=403673 RepID=A0A177W917_BATDL|nr:Ran-specific GTPase-activating protein 30 [Batrachochytrium dendrobatidis]OAJ36569.1 hypothetical protein BDEG_20732 [Batrachochytrium dendrobatidis JEL423]